MKVMICVEINFYGAFVLNNRVNPPRHRRDAARRRGGAGSSPCTGQSPVALVDFHTGDDSAARGLEDAFRARVRLGRGSHLPCEANWSREQHRRHFFWNEASGETRWERDPSWISKIDESGESTGSLRVVVRAGRPGEGESFPVAGGTALEGRRRSTCSCGPTSWTNTV